MSLSIQGRTAIVTGAGHGIGRAIADHFVSLGANVMFADWDETALQVGLAQHDPDSGPVRWFSGDLSQRLTLANLLSATLDAFDRVDILVNAHRLVRETDPLEPDSEAVEEMLRHNVMGPLRLSQIVARRMIRQATDEHDPVQAGAIVNLTTLAGARPDPARMGYSIACAAQEQATRNLALVLAPRRIRVNAVRFGSVMSHELKQSLKADADLRARMLAGTPLGRIAGPDELTEVVHYLVSEGARFVTGQVLTVDGGRSLVDGVTGTVRKGLVP
ncbi:7-alpha-hydroxysteroid dehydrogenase [Paracoccus alcaliphilus]|uniref:7-alpha-hydroxysteroid dehydrogenase n=1 Tax=Paracoccus alcaliphilus TaxID=34002 RepID=A0A1H8KZK3_9RHOB|nr:SDR family oxidoreductase [Paracoccus alcaliphilus]WCR17722.1 SDR family oxidoreductase [Paracoccus alcaliphilus]SEN98325.1 7-alpha-hydroxysteroid dehydrogenase [Paracoccus alcaliphilus]